MANLTPTITPSKRQKKTADVNKKARCVHVLRDRVYVDGVAKMETGEAEKNSPTKELRHRLFVDDTFKSFFRRLSWTPDGNYLLVPSGKL